MLKQMNSPAAIAYAVAVLSSIGALASLAIYGLQFSADLLAPYFVILAVVETVATVSNLGLTQFIQRTASASPCRGASLLSAAFRLRFVASVACGLAATCYLLFLPATNSIHIAAVVAVLLLMVVSGMARLAADFLESDGAIVAAQLVRGSNGFFRLGGLMVFSLAMITPNIFELIVIELIAALFPGIAALSYLLIRVLGDGGQEAKLELSFKEMAAYGSNDWSYVLQSPAVVRLISAWFLNAESLTLLSLAQSIVNPIARYTPAVMLRGMWMSRASKAYKLERDNLNSDRQNVRAVIRAAYRANAFYLIAAVPAGIGIGTVYLMRATEESLGMVVALCTMLVIAGATLSFRVLSEIQLQIRGDAGIVAKASIGGAVIGLVCGLLGNQFVLAWASVGLTATIGWWVLSAMMQGDARCEPMGTPDKRDLLFICRDMLPLWRVDISSLFGRYLPRYDWVVRWHVLQPQGESVPAWISHDAVCSINLRGGKLLGTRRWFLERARDLLSAAAVFKSPPGLIVIRDDYLSLLIAGIAARLKGVPCAYWMSFLMEDGYVELGRQSSGLKAVLRITYGRIYGWVGHWALRTFADTVFAQSEVMAGIVARRMKFAGRIIPVHMAVDFELLPPMVLTKGNPSTLVLGYSGAITLLRGFEELLKGVAMARELGVPLRLVVVGWYETRLDQIVLERLIDDLGLVDLIEHNGRLSQAASCAIISKCDVGLSPCPNSAMYAPASPTKLFEYLALGKMVIASEHPVQRAVIEEAKAGWVVLESAINYSQAISEAYELKKSGTLSESSERLRNYCEAQHSYANRAEVVDFELASLLR